MVADKKTPPGAMHGRIGLDPETLPIDEMDKSILYILIENSRTSNTEIAKRLEVNESTVRRRIEGLMERGVIEGFTVQLSSPKMDACVRAYIYIKVDTPALDGLVDELCASDNSLSVNRIVGAYDVVCEMVFKSMNDLHRFYDALFKQTVVRDIMAHIVVNCYKTHHKDVR